MLKANTKIEVFWAVYSEALVISFTVCLDYSETLSLLELSPQKLEKKIKLWHQSTKIPFWGCHNHYGFSSGEFHWRPCTKFCPGFETMNESVNARTSGCKFMTSARIIFFFFNSYSKPYNKQLNNLDRSVVAGKSQTSAYRIDLAIARSIRQGPGLRFSRNDLTLGY